MLWTGQLHDGSGGETFWLGVRIERDNCADWYSEDREFWATETMVTSMASDLEAA